MSLHNAEYINKILDLDFPEIIYIGDNSCNRDDDTCSESSQSSTCSGADLWQFISHKCNESYPCMDVSFNVIDDYDYYGYDFSGTKKVVQFFFTGNSQYFPAIWIGDADINEIKNLDEYPIYIFDLQMCDDKPLYTVGNFKTYINHIVDTFLENYTTNSALHYDHVRIAKIIKEKCCALSDNLIHDNKYVLN